jgi:hypothetical protein
VFEGAAGVPRRGGDDVIMALVAMGVEGREVVGSLAG